MILDGHVTIGANRDVELGVEDLLAVMDGLGIDRALVSPPEGLIPVRNREGNELACAASDASDGRLLAYAVATPWLGQDAVAELERARERGARALKLDPALQGFEPRRRARRAARRVRRRERLARVRQDRHAAARAPAPARRARLALPRGRLPHGTSGATDFGRDGPPALEVAPNLYADTAHINWPVALAAADPDARVVFTTDAPFGDPAVELARVAEAPLADGTREAVLGARLVALIGL